MHRKISAALMLTIALLGVGCAEIPTVQPETEAAAIAPPTALPGLSPTERLRRGLQLLEDGDEATGRVELVAYMQNSRRSAIGRSLLRQIDTPPEEYFPAEFREVILRKGQSLSNIAETYLGNAIEFHALAKYNGIERPKRMFPGQIVKVPLTDEAEKAFSELEDALDEPALDSLPLAESLDSQPGQLGDASEATTLKEKIADTQVLNAPGETEEIEASQEQVDGSAAASLEPALATPAPEIDVDAMHRRAINAYRAQDLDTAISLWNQILDADPSYEGARLYRSQALALNKRLKSFD